MTEIIGLGGRAKAGKTTVAAMLVDIIKPTKYAHIEFSDPIVQVAQQWLALASTEQKSDCSTHDRHATWLREVLKEELGVETSSNQSRSALAIPDSYLDTLKSRNVALNKETKQFHRPLLEWLGATAITLSQRPVWGEVVTDRIIESRAQGAILVTVGGVRSAADCKVVKDQEGKIIKIERQKNNGLLPSETGLDRWQADETIVNNGSLDQLQTEVVAAWNRLNAPVTIYRDA